MPMPDGESTMSDLIDVLEEGDHKSEESGLLLRADNGAVYRTWIAGTYPVDGEDGSKDA